MKRSLLVSALCLLQGLVPAYAGIDFGSDASALGAVDGTLALGNASLAHGMLLQRGGTITSTDATFEGITHEIRTGGISHMYTVDGVVSLNDSITLSDDQVLKVQGGQLGSVITVESSYGSSAIIEGYGQFNDAITLGAGAEGVTYGVTLRWDGLITDSIECITNPSGGARVTLEQDAHFARGKLIDFSSMSSSNMIVFDGYTMELGDVSFAADQSWNQPSLVLSSDVGINDSVTVTCGGGTVYLQGNGYVFEFGEGAVLDNGGESVYAVDTIFVAPTATSFVGASDWYGSNVTMYSDAGEFVLNGSFASGSDFFGGDVSIGQTTIDVRRSFPLAGTWTATNTVTVLGNGLEMSLASGNFYNGGYDCSVANILFSSATGDTLTGAGDWNLTDVTFAFEGASMTFNSGRLTGDTENNFYNGVAHFADACIRLNTDLSVIGTWITDGITVISGDGATLYAQDLWIAPDAGSTLVLHDMTLVISNSTFATDRVYALNLHNVTVRFVEYVDWSSSSITLNIKGPSTFVVDSYAFLAPTETDIDDLTLWVDDLGRGGYVSGFLQTDRIMYVNGTQYETTFTDSAGLTENMYLYPSGDGRVGRSLMFGGGADIDIYGYSRSIVFPANDSVDSSPVVLVDDTNTVVQFRDVTLENYRPEVHLSLSDSATQSVRYGDGTTIKLGSDCYLSSGLDFGSWYIDTTETMILDLNGHTLTFSSEDAYIWVNGSGVESARTLIIRNGRIAQWWGMALYAEVGQTIVFDNVELAQSSNVELADGYYTFRRHCAISTPYGSEYRVVNTSTANLLIEYGATLTLHDGVEYVHANDGTGNFILDGELATLELLGATFTHDDAAVAQLTITDGMIVIDHKVRVNPGTNGLIWGAYGDGNVNLVVRPGAQVILNSAGTFGLTHTVV